MFLNTRRRFLQIPFVDGLFSLKRPVLGKADQPSQKPEIKIIPERVRLELWRHPYLQSQGPDRITIRWRTNQTIEPGIVRFGPSVNDLNLVSKAKQVPSQLHEGMDWIAEIVGLEPNHKYYYAIEHSKAVLAGIDDHHHFQTSGPIGNTEKSRFLVLGDCGTNRVNTGNPTKALFARNGFRKYQSRTEKLDGMILLGDNAYSHGTDAQYESGFFLVYEDELKNLPLWPCIGNHEISDDYLSIFTVPSHGEVGGTASNSTNYYSWDYANIHFTVLDLWKAEWRTENSPQIQWLKQDLASTKQHWRVVINHFPPYCDGKYESDTNGFLVEVRNKILPILEDHGSDLFLTGHDHTYQRTYLIDSHYGPRSTFDPEKHLKSNSDGVSTPIHKKNGPKTGMITVVTGTAGGEQPADLTNPNSTQLSHPAMVKLAKGEQMGRGIRKIGTFILEVHGEKLTGLQLDQNGETLDEFHLIKPVS